ncbi:MAG: ATP-binding protein [Bacillota bacterium]
MKLHQLKEALNRVETNYNRRAGQAEVLQKMREEALSRYKEAVAAVELLEKVRLLLQEASACAREQSCRQIEGMVAHTLEFVFGQGMSFKVDLLERRNQPEAEFYVVSSSDGVEIKTRPQDARGGGVVDVTSLALRVALLETSRPPLPGPLLLDEPGKHLSDEYAPHLALLLKELSGTFGRQVVMVTHNRYFTEAADKVYLVQIKGGKSMVTTLDPNEQ